MIVTTPEKWDVVTRKSTGDVALTQLVRLLIIDEIHLLHDDRGPVIESLVARTLRQVSAELESQGIIITEFFKCFQYAAQFLRVNPMEGLFFFDGRFRPVPLGQSFIGVKAQDHATQMEHMDDVCYEKALKFVRDGHQVMVFVHARNATGRTAASLKEMANNKGHSTLFIPENTAAYGLAQKMISKSRNRQLIDLFNSGFCIHHAGLLRSDRNIVEKLFAEGHIKVLCCTATLAWGVNLPAHAVIIKGTNIYDAKRSSFVDLGILDVQQIFGRAGRPQFDKSGFGLIITTHNKLPHYLSLLTRQLPIESQFINSLLDNLNAEIVLGTVSNVQEAVEWLSYTYLYVRMRKNPMAYGIKYNELLEDNALNDYRARLVKAAAAKLDSFKMIRFDISNECFYSTDIGRIASYYYIKSETIEVINQHLKDFLTDDAILALVSQSTEFNEIKVREEEMDELSTLYRHCHLPALGGAENTHGKVNILMQAHISKLPLDSFSLISDMSYVVQNVGRILRSLFDMAVRRNNAALAAAILNLCKSVEQRLWHNADHPLAQMCPSLLRHEVIKKLIDHKLKIEQINEMTAEELGHMTRSNGHEIKAAAARLPNIDVESRIKPITRSVLRVYLTITPDYVWDDRVHGRGSELFHIWVEDPETFFMYHREEFLLTKRQVIKKEVQEIMFTVPITEPMPSQYLVKWVSDRWIGSGSTYTLFLTNIILPERHPPHTALLNLQPLSVEALGNQIWQNLYKFKYFNAVQTQIFHCLFHTDENALIGAPTGSGKTVAAELAIFRIFKENPDGKK
uniref:Helicase C-terminal domain-containing protein n=1 Tax=Romanomermis culicivorax TaxID=13658 RepID=A0A915JEM2_ROMCU